MRKLLKDLEVEVLVENMKYVKILDVATRLKLLPSDAVIAVTCKYYGIDAILTFDEDFKESHGFM